MNQKTIGRALVTTLIVTALGLAGCSGSKAADITPSDNNQTGQTNTMSGDISVYSREDGSGTRGAFVELFEVEEKDSNGDKVDLTTLSASITNSTSVMMTSIASDENGIGYISLGSLNDTVKALKIDGVAATAEHVKDGSYAISRPFNITTKDKLSEATQDFIDFIMSTEGQTIVEKEGYVAADGSGKPYKASGQSGRIVVAGSSSVTPVMEKLQEAYLALNPDTSIEVQQNDSTTGINMAIEGTCDIGMASRELKDSEIQQGLESLVIAQDGIAIIVNPHAVLDGLKKEQVKDIYVGNTTAWEHLLS